MKMRYIYFGIAIAFLLCNLQSIFALELPPKPVDYVSDFAQVISQPVEQQLNDELKAFADKTSTQVAVVTVKNIGDGDIESYANELFRSWGIGGKSNNNGILFLVAVDDKQMRIEVGYGLEGRLTDVQSASIIRNVARPAFASGNYDAGITQSVQKIESLVQGEIFTKDIKQKSTMNAKQVQNVASFVFVLLFMFGPLLYKFVLRGLGSSPAWWQGGMAGLGLAGIVSAFVFSSIIAIVAVSVIGTVLGLLLDYYVSKNYSKWNHSDNNDDYWGTGLGGGLGGWGGSGFGGGSGGGFSGFGGGSSGGGGASGDW